jgi:hypothetical protein
MDIRKLLHKYPKLKLAKENAKKGIAELERRDRIYRSDDNWFIRGTTVSDRTADLVIEEEAVMEKVELLKAVVNELDGLLSAMDSVLDVLGEEHRLIAKYRYFQGLKVPAVCRKISEETGEPYSERHFYYDQRLVIEDFQTSLGGLLYTYDEDFLERVQFIVTSTRLDATSKNHEAYNRLPFALSR